MEDKNILQQLEGLGFSERQAKVYLALLRKHNATSADLQKLSGIPQTKVYEIVRHLVSQGYCRERKVGRKRSFEAIDPETALNNPIQCLQDKIDHSLDLKQELSNIFKTSGQAIEPVEYMEVLYGKETIHNHFIQLVRQTNREILGFGRPPYSCDNDGKVQEQMSEFRNLERRGGMNKWIYQTELPDVPEWLASVFHFMGKQGIRYKVIDALPLKMMVFDRRAVLFAEEDSSTRTGELTMAIIKQAAVAHAFIALFNFFWQQAVELDDVLRNKLPDTKKFWMEEQ